jgi:hypothetical protein
MERRDAGLSFWIVGSGAHENANAPHPLGRRLRARHKRPRRRAAKKRDEHLASFHYPSSSRASGIKNNTPRDAALRDFSPIYVHFGS